MLQAASSSTLEFGDAQPGGQRGSVPALDRALRILSLLEGSPQRAFALSEIARALAIPKSSAFNICGALVEGQLLRRTRGGFQLGRGLVQLGSAYVSSVNIVGEFYDVCRGLSSDLEAAVQLAVLDEAFDTVYLAHQDCNSGLRLGLGGGVGRRVPANCTACGKALLSLLSPNELERRLAGLARLPKLTRNSITAKARLVEELVKARADGYARDAEETILGLACIATALPTPHVEGGVLAVSISARRDGLTKERAMHIQRTLDGLRDSLKQRI